MAEVTIPEGDGQVRRLPIDAPSNSNKAKEEKRPEIKAVTNAKVAKPSFGKRFKEAFTGDDARNVGDYVIFDVFVPSLKNFIFDAGRQSLERALFGSASPNRDYRRGAPSHRVQYGERYRSQGSVDRDQYDRRSRRDSYGRRERETFDFDVLIIEERGEAEEILECLADLIEKYGSATVSDFYKLTGVGGSHVDRKWGWTHLHGATTKAQRGGYICVLPEPVWLDDVA